MIIRRDKKTTRQSTMEEHLILTAAAAVCKPGIVKALSQIASYSKVLIEALNNRFGDDFTDPFVKEINDILDFNFMIDLEEKIESNIKTYEECLAIVKQHGLESLKKVVKRQDCEKV